jgi:hypothetical protein
MYKESHTKYMVEDPQKFDFLRDSLSGASSSNVLLPDGFLVHGNVDVPLLPFVTGSGREVLYQVRVTSRVPQVDYAVVDTAEHSGVLVAQKGRYALHRLPKPE